MSNNVIALLGWLIILDMNLESSRKQFSMLRRKYGINTVEKNGCSLFSDINFDGVCICVRLGSFYLIKIKSSIKIMFDLSTSSSKQQAYCQLCLVQHKKKFMNVFFLIWLKRFHHPVNTYRI